MTLWLAEIGFLSLLTQVVLLRELNVAFYGSELIYILALGIWLMWTAVGVSMGRRQRTPSLWRIRWLLLALGLLLPFDIAFVRGCHRLWGGVPGADLPFPQQIAAMSLALLPVGVALGLLFQWAAKLAIASGRTLALAYSLESAGGILGGAAATLALGAGLSNLTLGLLGALFCLVATAQTSPHPGVDRAPGRRFRILAGLSAIGLVLVIANAGTVDRWLTSWQHPLVRATRDTPYGRITISGLDGQISVFRNGSLTFESEGTTAEEFTHLALLQHPAPRDVLVLGGITEGLLQEAQKHRPRRLDGIELDPDAFDLTTALLSPASGENDLISNAHIHFGDPRRILEQLAGDYDAILVGMPEPSSAQANRFFTQEFFARCAARLRPRGVLAYRLPAAENLWTPPLLRRAASIQRAVAASFDDVIALPGATNVFIASRGRLTRDPEVLAARFRERNVSARLISPGYLRYLYTNDRFAEIEASLATTWVPANSDARPICYQYTLMIWLSRFYPALLWAELPALSAGRVGHLPELTGIAALLLLFLIVRRWQTARRLLLVGVAGFAGMVGETILILNYQMTCGILFQNLGLLLTVFMAGLALGSWGIHRLASSGGMRRGSDRKRRLTRRWGIALVASFALVCWGFAQLLSGGFGGLAASAAGLLIYGAFTAALFSYASLAGIDEQRAWVSPLYAADLVGGCVGSLVGSLLLVPLLGFASTTAGLALVAAAAVLLI